MGRVHDLLEARGRQAARDLVEGRRGPRIVEAAAGWASDEDISTGYMYSGWCQTALPHRRPSDDTAIWKLETDSMTLLVEPGVRVIHGSDPVHVGVPFGAIARLILIYLQSEALRTGSRDIELGGSLRAFLGRLGISVGGRTTKLVRGAGGAHQPLQAHVPRSPARRKHAGKPEHRRCGDVRGQ